MQEITLKITDALGGPTLLRKGKQDAICPGKVIRQATVQHSFLNFGATCTGSFNVQRLYLPTRDLFPTCRRSR